MRLYHDRLIRLTAAVQRHRLLEVPLQSRVHPIQLREVARPGVELFIKRDDEIGSLTTNGAKLRKFSSLIPHLLDKGVKVAGVIGGTHANNTPGLTSTLLQHGIIPFLFLKRSHAVPEEPASIPLSNPMRPVHGKGGELHVFGIPPQSSASSAQAENLISQHTSVNAYLTTLLVDRQQVHYVEETDWPHAELVAAEKLKKITGETHPCVIPEGASTMASLPGALSLALDFARNRGDGSVLDGSHVFMDSGTGFTASAFIVASAYLGWNHHTHVLLLADSPLHFMNRLADVKLEFAKLLNISPEDVELKSNNFTIHCPSLGRSFGSVPSTTLLNVASIARQTGIILDPICSGKLIYDAAKIIAKETDIKNAVIIHSGGGANLLGF